ncbi:MAG TPA: peptide chain release factor N(5)-glutamine methyltransferase [Acetobacteraceae bacterium]|nr:peptide chain release factor N(5)-glutamine methyltransferase [Acetobacteraceae bacterium]
MEYEAPTTLSVAEAVARLAAAGIAAPQREARLLLAHALGRAPETMLGERVPPPPGFASLIARRAAREPLGFILERREFWSLSFSVSPATLIPRPETETLLEAALVALPRRAAVQRVLDLGTGTGCLLLAALTEFPAAFGVGVDLVAEAALLARRNAEALGLASRTAFLVGNWAAALGGAFDLILANPPYIERARIPGLMPEVARFEPRSALDGGWDGLDAYRWLLPALPRLLAPDGLAILELGAGGADRVARLVEAEGLAIQALKSDLEGNSRALVLASRGHKKPFGSEG